MYTKKSKSCEKKWKIPPPPVIDPTRESIWMGIPAYVSDIGAWEYLQFTSAHPHLKQRGQTRRIQYSILYFIIIYKAKGNIYCITLFFLNIT